MSNSLVEVSGVICPKCEDYIWSRNRHDFRFCSCGYCSIDGGFDYLKFGFGGEKFEQPWTPPVFEKRTIELTVFDKKLMKREPRFPY